MVAVDLISFYKLSKSIDIQRGSAGQGLKIPSSRQAMTSMFLEYGKNKMVYKKDGLLLLKMIENGDKFSLTLDEWSSDRNQRYMCLNLHLSDNSVQCLGMMRIVDSMKAEDGLKLIETKIEDFELNINNHTFGMVTDGAKVMKKPEDCLK